MGDRRIFHEETYEGFRLTVGQESSGAGLYWRLEMPSTLLGRFDYMSPGRFYREVHGTTVEDVVQTAIACAKRWLAKGK